MADRLIIKRFTSHIGWVGLPEWVEAVALAVHAEAKLEAVKGRGWRATARWMRKARHDAALATKFRVMVGLGGGKAVVRWAVAEEGRELEGQQAQGVVTAIRRHNPPGVSKP